MTYTDRKIVESYTDLLEGLSSSNKAALIENLSRSITPDEEEKKERAFYSAFGGWKSEKSADELVKEIKASRKFRKKDIKF